MVKASTTHGQAQRTFRQLVGAFRHSEGSECVLGVLGLMGKHCVGPVPRVLQVGPG